MDVIIQIYNLLIYNNDNEILFNTLNYNIIESTKCKCLYFVKNTNESKPDKKYFGEFNDLINNIKTQTKYKFENIVMIDYNKFT